MNTTSSLEPLEARIAPAALTVTNLNDNGAGSLRAAIAASHSGDTIAFKTGLTGLIHVKTQMLINHNLTINGGGKITLDGVINGDFGTRFFEVDDGNAASTAQVKISGFTMRDGLAFNPGLSTVQAGNNGAAIENKEALTVANCVLIGNEAQSFGGAIYSDSGSQLTVQDCNLAKNSAGGSGGGIYVSAGAKSVTITGTTFGNNGARSVAALDIEGTLSGYTISNCNFHANNSDDYVSGAYLVGSGTLSNSTFSLNDSLAIPGSPGDHEEVPHETIGIVVGAGQTAKMVNVTLDHNHLNTVVKTGAGTLTQTNTKFL